MKTKNELATTPTATLTPAEHKQLGEELTALYQDAIDGHLRVLAFGARFLAAENIVSTCGNFNLLSCSSSRKGTGMKAWLAQYAPEISQPTACRFRDIAQAVADKFKIADPARIFTTTPKELLPADLKKRETALEFTAEKSMRAIQLELGLIVRKTEAQRIGEKIAEARARGEKLPVDCCHYLSPEKQEWWDGLHEDARIAHNAWHAHFAFLDNEQAKKHYLHLPKIEQLALKQYVSYFAKQLAGVKA